MSAVASYVLKLSSQEKAELLSELCQQMPDDEIYDVLDEALEDKTKERFGERWFNVDS